MYFYDAVRTLHKTVMTMLHRTVNEMKSAMI